MRRGGPFNDGNERYEVFLLLFLLLFLFDFITNLLLGQRMKSVSKSDSSWRSYREEYGVFHFLRARVFKEFQRAVRRLSGVQFSSKRRETDDIFTDLCYLAVHKC